MRVGVRRGLALICLALLLALFTLDYGSGGLAAGSIKSNPAAIISRLSLTGFNRILIVAPHPDDETLGPGGLIQVALANGAQVRVVVVTNGDGQRLGPTILANKFRPRPTDYVKVGERRQAESISALKWLGLLPEDVSFLGYPDRGLSSMWEANWNTQCPYRSRFTRAIADPYLKTYRPGVGYCGRNLLTDLEAIIREFRPDLIVLPHPADQNADHRATSNFARLALADLRLQDPSYQPGAWGYVVHYGTFPRPRGAHFGRTLIPPTRLLNAGDNWGELSLSSKQIETKYRAIELYSSQTLLLGRFLPSFARVNELFAPLGFLDLISGSLKNLPALSTAGGQASQESSLELIEDLPARGNGILSWQIARLGDTVWVWIQTRTENVPTLRRVLEVKLPDGSTQSIIMRPAGPLLPEDSYVAQLDLTGWKYPGVLCLSASIKEAGFTTTQTGWHILMLTP